jgi:hypothetical protein
MARFPDYAPPAAQMVAVSYNLQLLRDVRARADRLLLADRRTSAKLITLRRVQGLVVSARKSWLDAHRFECAPESPSRAYTKSSTCSEKSSPGGGSVSRARAP